MLHEKLVAYQEGLALAVELSEKCDKEIRNYALKDQMSRAALSIPLNIAEGTARRTPKDRMHFFVIARGSTAECGAMLDMLHRRQQLDPAEFNALKTKCHQVSTLLHRLIDTTRRKMATSAPKSSVRTI
jgi:four helix bundle protein